MKEQLKKKDKYKKVNEFYVAEDGEVLDVTNYRKGWRKGNVTTTGYLSIGYNNLVHRLVALAFIPNPCNKPHVNHIDNNPLNNEVSNLEWCTPAENIAHSKLQGRQQHLKELNKDYCSNEVHQYTKAKVYIGTYASSMEAERQTGVSNGNIASVLNGNRQTAGGFKWLRNKITNGR